MPTLVSAPVAGQDLNRQHPCPIELTKCCVYMDSGGRDDSKQMNMIMSQIVPAYNMKVKHRAIGHSSG